MNPLYALGALLVVVLGIYLFGALLRPEKFG